MKKQFNNYIILLILYSSKKLIKTKVIKNWNGRNTWQSLELKFSNLIFFETLSLDKKTWE